MHDESYNTKPVVETTSLLVQLETHGCTVAQELLETPEVQRGFEVVKPMRRLSTLYNIPPPDIYFQRKADVEFESGLSDEDIKISLGKVQELCYTYYPLAEFKAKVGHRIAILQGVSTDTSDTEMLAKEMVDRVVWCTINLDFSNVPEAAAKLSATVAANLNHIDDQLRKRFRRNLELDSDRYISSVVYDYPDMADGWTRRSDSIRAIREVAQSISYREFTTYITTLGVREQTSVLIWLGYFQNYPDIKSALNGLGMSAEAYRIGLASVAKKIVDAFGTNKRLSDTTVTMSKLATNITVGGLISINERLVRLNSSLERVVFCLREKLTYPDNLTPIELQTIRLLDEYLQANKPFSLRDIAHELGYNVKSVQKIVHRVARKSRT